MRIFAPLGRRYRYMIRSCRLDHDGARAREAVAIDGGNPNVGIIQTAPRIVNGETLFARCSRSRVGSKPLFLAGLTTGSSTKETIGTQRGHSRATVHRTLCTARLAGNRAVRRTHFVAMTRRGRVDAQGGLGRVGSPRYDGTYEEGPPSLIDSAKRESRWCQGKHAAPPGFSPRAVSDHETDSIC